MVATVFKYSNTELIRNQWWYIFVWYLPYLGIHSCCFLDSGIRSRWRLVKLYVFARIFVTSVFCILLADGGLPVFTGWMVYRYLRLNDLPVFGVNLSVITVDLPVSRMIYGIYLEKRNIIINFDFDVSYFECIEPSAWIVKRNKIPTLIKIRILPLIRICHVRICHVRISRV